MFSFRTTPLDEQQDLVLHRGRIAVLCNQAAWNPEKEEYLFETIHRNGNLVRIFYPADGIFGENPEGTQTAGYPELGYEGCSFQVLRSREEGSSVTADMLEGIDALLIEYQDTGSRYDPSAQMLYDLFTQINETCPRLSVYILDRENPCGRWVEGTMLTDAGYGRAGVRGIPHRHGLTLGELANLFYSETGAKFPLHIISYLVRSATQFMMPWSIPPYPDVPGLLTFHAYCGMALFDGTDISNGKGTSRPYEIFGAPYLSGLLSGEIPEEMADPGVFLRKTVFTPRFGRYAGEKCYGFQFLPRPGVPYHSVAHVLRILKCIGSSYGTEHFSGLTDRVGDEVMMHYLSGETDWTALKEHIKIEEQKWSRKAKRYMLYDEQLSRVKTLV